MQFALAYSPRLKISDDGAIPFQNQSNDQI